MLITEAYHEAYSDCHGLVEMNRKQMAAEEDVNFSERTVYEAVNKLSGSTEYSTGGAEKSPAKCSKSKKELLKVKVG